MKKYVSILLTAVLGASLLAGCARPVNSDQKPAADAQPEAQAEAQADTQAEADTAKAADAYYVYVKDAETMASIPGASVQFCSDVMCQMARTDESGTASIPFDSETYTVHFMAAPEGYVKSTEEFTLDKDNNEAVYFLEKEAGSDSTDTAEAEADSEMDFPSAGFTFAAPEEFSNVSGALRTNDYGEVTGETGVTIGYVGYQAKTEDDFLAYLESLGVTDMEDVTDEIMDSITEFYSDSPTLVFFRVMSVRGDQNTDEINGRMFDSPPLVFDEIGSIDDYKFYYVVLDDEKYYEELRGTGYPQDKLEEAYNIWKEAATTDKFKERITVKEPEYPAPAPEEGTVISFETVDLDGNPVTSEELFADHDVTVINIWATWCINCKQEMEELEALNKEWADKGCQIIGICDDAVDDAMIASAKKILEEHGVTFPNVVMSQEIREVLVANGLPTTYFVDSEGKILCDPITGKYVEKYVETLEDLLSGK